MKTINRNQPFVVPTNKISFFIVKLTYMKPLFFLLLFFAFTDYAKSQTITVNATLANTCLTTAVNDTEEGKDKFDLTIFPNPAIDVSNIQISTGVERKKITMQIFDISGRIVFGKMSFYNVSTQNYIVYTNNFKAGMYLVVIQTKDQKISKKLIVIK